MAVYNEILVGRYNRWFQKVTGIKGGAPVKQLGSEILPVLPILHGIEERYLYSWFRFRAATTSGPIAAVTSGLRIRNPAGSNVIACIESSRLHAIPADAAYVATLNRGQIGVDLDTTAGLAGGSQREDPRGQAASTCILSINTVALVTLNNATQIMSQVVAPSGVDDSVRTQNQEILLFPGDSLQWANITAQNAALRVSLCWRERFLEESERT
jgi:hypothetical protein